MLLLWGGSDGQGFCEVKDFILQLDSLHTRITTL